MLQSLVVGIIGRWRLRDIRDRSWNAVRAPAHSSGTHSMSGSTESTPERDQFTSAITCAGCGQNGIAVWEENHTISPRGPEPTLVSLSKEFYERISKKSPHDIELVCQKCGAVQPE